MCRLAFFLGAIASISSIWNTFLFFFIIVKVYARWLCIFTLCLLIWLKAAKSVKIFIPVTLFYGNKNVCVRFVRWFLYALLLLKMIVSMKRCYVGVLEYTEKRVGFVCVLFLKLLKCEKCMREKAIPGLSDTHCWNKFPNCAPRILEE